MEENDPKGEAFHLAGDRLGKFVILSELGRGSMGVVYEAFQEGLKRKVALKILPANITLDEKHVKRFHREAESVGRLNHPHVIQIYDNGTIDKTHYFAMEIVDGTDFAAVRCEGRELILRAARLIRDAARGLQHAHAEGVIHRDIKPSNLLVDRNDRVVVTDFGLAHVKDSASLTSTDAIVGTPKYMAPEQILPKGEELDGRADVYSLGATLYEAIAGRPPLEAPSVQAFFKAILEERPASPRKSNRDCPHDLATIVMRCLEKSPDDRYAGAKELANDLDRFLRGGRIRARPKGALALAGGWVRRHRVIASLSALALVGAVATLMLSGQVARQTGTVQLYQRISELRSQKDEELDLAIEEAEDLGGEHPGNPEVKKLLQELYGRRADKGLEEPEITWHNLLRDLESAGRTADLWYLMGLFELERLAEVNDVLPRLPAGSEARAAARARLQMKAGKLQAAIGLLAGRATLQPFSQLVLAQAHHAASALEQDAAKSRTHLEQAEGLLRKARAAVRARWLRGQVQYELWMVQWRLGKSVSLRDSVDDFTVIANQWWGKIASAWEGMSSTDVGNLKIFVSSILRVAGLEQTLAAEIEFKANERLKLPGPQDQMIGNLLLAVAHLSNRRIQDAWSAFQEASNIDADEVLPLLPYVHWGLSITHRARDDLKLAIANAELALEGAVLEREFQDLEPLSRHTVQLMEDAHPRDPALARRARESLKAQLDSLNSPAAWVSEVLKRIASRASR